MKLTRRQEEFVDNLFELSQELEGPIHYSVLAERLGVSPFTAYDMLCLLEEKGLASSEYQLSSDKSGPGRAERVFFPASSAITHRQHLREATSDSNLDDSDLKELFMARLHKGELKDKELAEGMLARIPPNGHGSMRYCMEVMTIAGLRLRQCPGREVLTQFMPDILPADGSANRTNLCTLGGFVFGVLSKECAGDHEWVVLLFEHIRNYIEMVINMSQDESQMLGAYLVSVFQTEIEDLPDFEK